MTLTLLAEAATALSFENLGLSPIALDLGFFQVRWYSVAYIAGILIGWWYLMKLIAQPGAPMARRHADDMVFYATLGILIGGRLGYVLFYRPEMIENPADIFKLWEGGMSFHGGVIGVSLAIILLARLNRLDWLRIHDYVACCVPFGLFFGRLANFVNGELWGRATDLPWAVAFPGAYAGGVPRHPSQLYEAALEGILLFAVLAWAFWRTQARYEPGKLVGIFLIGYGLSRFLVEFVREPDEGVTGIIPGLTQGQSLTLPMIAGGLYLIATAKSRRDRDRAVTGETVA